MLFWYSYFYLGYNYCIVLYNTDRRKGQVVSTATHCQLCLASSAKQISGNHSIAKGNTRESTRWESPGSLGQHPEKRKLSYLARRSTIAMHCIHVHCLQVHSRADPNHSKSKCLESMFLDLLFVNVLFNNHLCTAEGTVYSSIMEVYMSQFSWSMPRTGTGSCRFIAQAWSC